MVELFHNYGAGVPKTIRMDSLMLYRIQLVVALLVLYSSNVSAGINDVPTVMPNGCTMSIHRPLDPSLVTNIFRAEGACKNGLAEGFWSFGMERNQDRTFVYRSLRQGQLSGINFVLGRTGAMISVVDPDSNGTQMLEYLKRDSSPAEELRFLSVIDDANAVASRLRKPKGDSVKMKSLIRKWKQGDDAAIDQWFTNSGSSPSSDAVSREWGAADDLKSTGRGARGD